MYANAEVHCVSNMSGEREREREREREDTCMRTQKGTECQTVVV